MYIKKTNDSHATTYNFDSILVPSKVAFMVDLVKDPF